MAKLRWVGVERVVRGVFLKGIEVLKMISKSILPWIMLKKEVYQRNCCIIFDKISLFLEQNC